jgi:hypothetical protein
LPQRKLQIVAIAATGRAAIDYGRANTIKEVQLQAALDSTALMVSKTAATFQVIGTNLTKQRIAQ